MRISRPWSSCQNTEMLLDRAVMSILSTERLLPRETESYIAVSNHCLDICSPHTNKLDGVMPRALHGPKAVQ